MPSFDMPPWFGLVTSTGVPSFLYLWWQSSKVDPYVRIITTGRAHLRTGMETHSSSLILGFPDLSRSGAPHCWRNGVHIWCPECGLTCIFLPILSHGYLFILFCITAETFLPAWLPQIWEMLNFCVGRYNPLTTEFHPHTVFHDVSLHCSCGWIMARKPLFQEPGNVGDWYFLATFFFPLHHVLQSCF